MSKVIHLSCGSRNCVYGNEEGELPYGQCKCVPYPSRDKFQDIEKIKSAKWAIHTLRRENAKLNKQIDQLQEMLYGG
jgi:hypothetical protein